MKGTAEDKFAPFIMEALVDWRVVPLVSNIADKASIRALQS
jgi:hypothetical protein